MKIYKFKIKDEFTTDEFLKIKEEAKKEYETNFGNSSRDKLGIGKRDDLFLGHMNEKIFEKLFGKYYEKNEDEFGKWDFKSKGVIENYIDIKSFKTSKTPEDAAKANYNWFLQKFQVEKAKKYCEENKINLADYKYIICYYNGDYIDDIYFIFDNIECTLQNILEKNVEEKNPGNTKIAKGYGNIKNYILKPNWKYLNYCSIK